MPVALLGGHVIKRKERKEINKMKENKIAHIYTAKVSKSGKYVNITAVYDDEEGNRFFLTIPVKIAKYDGKPSAVIDENVVNINIKFSKDAPKQEAVKADADEMPF